MNEDMYKLITTSNHVSSGKFPLSHQASATRGKALSILQGVSKKRGSAMNPAGDITQLNQTADTGINT